MNYEITDNPRMATTQITNFYLDYNESLIRDSKQYPVVLLPSYWRVKGLPQKTELF